MKALFKYTGTSFKPMFDSDHEQMKADRFKIGEVYELEFRKPRNVFYHRKFFAMLNLVFSNQEYFEDIETLRRFLIMKAGYYTVTITPKGKFYNAKSISFASMDQSKFEKLFWDVINIVDSELIPGISEHIEEELIEFM